MDKCRSQLKSLKKYDKPQLVRMNKYRNRWMTADENGWKEAVGTQLMKIHEMDSWFTTDNYKSGEPIESQLMRMKGWNDWITADENDWERIVWPKLMSMKASNSWIGADCKWMRENSLLHLMRMNESKTEENEWERRTVCYSWWEWLSGKLDHNL